MFGPGHEKLRKSHASVMHQVRLCAFRDFIEKQQEQMLQHSQGCCRWSAKAGGRPRWVNERPIKGLFPIRMEARS
jgi:hypothetical protein